jgi:hypothetical protein
MIALLQTTRSGATRAFAACGCSCAHCICSYAAFVTDIALKYYARPSIAIFLAYGPMTDYYQPLVQRTVAVLQSAVRFRLTVSPLSHLFLDSADQRP